MPPPPSPPAAGTGVELDAASQVEVTCEMDERGLIPVGWYHSHPVFEARPSAKDNENQRNYQALCRDAGTGLEPWVGAIVGPYDQALPSPASMPASATRRSACAALPPRRASARFDPARGGAGAGGATAVLPSRLCSPLSWCCAALC